MGAEHLVSKLDDLDRAIIRLLQADGRRSNRDIGRLLDVAEGTIRARLKKLHEHHEFEIVVLKNPSAFGLDCFAHLQFHVTPKYAVEFADELAAFREVVFSSVMASRYNVYGVAITKSRDALDKFLETKVAPLDGLLDYRVLENVEAFRFDYHWMV